MRWQEFFDAESERIPVLSLRREHLVAALLTSALLFQGCATTGAPEQGAQRGLNVFALGVKNLVLSPLMIASGLAQGLAFLPYVVGASLDELNKGLLDAHSVSLDDSYRATYGVSMRDARVHQETGEVIGEIYGFGRHRPEAMLEATQAFQRLLRSQGMPAAQAEHYALVGDYTHVRVNGQILLAVVHRRSAMSEIRVTPRHSGIVTVLRPQQQAWSRAYATDARGQVIDEVIDWAALDYAALRHDKVVATLLAIAAEGVKADKRAPDYWAAQENWSAGDLAGVKAASRAKVASALQLVQ